VVIDSRNEPRPDVVLIREEGADRTPVLAADVLLAVEIVSPESAARDRHDKMRLYACAGISAYWLIDPLAERVTFTEYLPGRGRCVPPPRAHRRPRHDRPAVGHHPRPPGLDPPPGTAPRGRPPRHVSR
jgi:hypothetical protein